jgi:hypothetical protein
MDWIHLPQDGDQVWAVVNWGSIQGGEFLGCELGVHTMWGVSWLWTGGPYKVGSFLTSWGTIDFSRWTLLHKVYYKGSPIRALCSISPTHVNLIAYFHHSFRSPTWLVPNTIFETINFPPSTILTWLSHRLVRWAHYHPVSYLRGSVFKSRPSDRLSRIFHVIFLS